MTISGFTIIRNAINYDFPVVECIKSLLELVDELVIALGDNNDRTEELVDSIKSDKIKIIRTNWDSSKYNKDGQVYANQTDIALKACKGDWCIYLQADEVLHEDAIPVIREACKKYKDKPSVEGFLLRYVHLYADYHHYISARHFGYPKEVRIVRNVSDIHSWRDAQSFRLMPGFDYENYWQKENTRVLKCILLKNAFVYHYGWSRDPRKMVKKREEQSSMHSGEKTVFTENFHDYGNIACLPEFKGSHPAVMNERVSAMDWSNYLRYTGAPAPIKKIFAPRYRVLNFFENTFLPNGNRIFGFKNYKQTGIF